MDESTKLYDNYQNYLYPVDNYPGIIDDGEDKYLLFNPSNHYWVSFDRVSARIYELIRSCHRLGDVKERLAAEYGIDDDIFFSDVMPFIEELAGNGFLGEDKKEGDAAWTGCDPDKMDADSFPFNDMYISLSDSCNLDCIYCFNKGRREDRGKTEGRSGLSCAQIVRVMEQYRDMKGCGVCFTGGEPTLNDGLTDLCREAKRIGLRTRVITNGTRLHRLDLDALLENLDHITISLDSCSEEELSLLWNVPAGELVPNIRASLVKLGHGAERFGTQITIAPIVSGVNKDSLGGLTAMVKELMPGCRVLWNMTRYDETGQKEVDDMLAVTGEQYAESYLNSMLPNYKGKRKGLAEAYAISDGGKRYPPDRPRFLLCAPSFFMTARGEVYPCQGLEKEEYDLGNVRDMELKDMFEGKEFSCVRQCLPVQKSRCAGCELRFVCTEKGGVCQQAEPLSADCRKKMIRRMYLRTL